MGYGGYGSGSYWAPYVSVGQKLAMAKKQAAKVAKKQKREPSPVSVSGRVIAKSFWGKAWCDNLTAYSDFSNRLPRGATYFRNGSVADLVITTGKIEAIVAGSEPYEVSITIDKLAKTTWNKIKQNCSSSIDSLFDLLAGRLSDGVMKGLTNKTDGCFPSPREIKMKCSCPDYSYCCKHIAAVMYGVGNRLDTQPELLFLLRGVDHAELVSAAVSKGNLAHELASSSGSGIADSDLSELFGIELDNGASSQPLPASATPGKRRKQEKGTRQTVASDPTDSKSPRTGRTSSDASAAQVASKQSARRSAAVRNPFKLKEVAAKLATKKSLTAKKVITKTKEQPSSLLAKAKTKKKVATKKKVTSTKSLPSRSTSKTLVSPKTASRKKTSLKTVCSKATSLTMAKPK